MEHLTKQQIVLLTLLVSFVTSIATGIVAVSLMDQAPSGVTQTINHIVERTIEKAVVDPNSSQTQTTAAALTFQDFISNAAQKVSQSVVRIKPRGGGTDSVIGIGLVLSDQGVIITDKSNTAPANLVAVFSDGKEFPIQVLQSQILGDISFVATLAPKDYAFTPVTIASPSSSKLGETVLSIGGKYSDTLDQGFVSQAPLPLSSGPQENVETSISSKNLMPGSPLFDISGNVLGLKTSSLMDAGAYHSLDTLADLAPKVTR